MSYTYLFKLILVGDSGVGKSSLLYRFINSKYINYKELTIGVDFGTHTIKINDDRVKLHIWDTAGQECFKAITRQYYKDAVGIMVCYDVTDYTSFMNITDWMKDIKESCEHAVVIMIVGTKTDLKSKRVVTHDEGVELAQKYDALFAEVSS